LADEQEEQEPAYDRWSRPHALSNRGYVLAVLVPVLVAAAAFGVVSLVSEGDEPTISGTSVRLPVSGWAPGAGGDAALIEGVLRVDSDQCVYLESGQDGDQPGKVWPVWPAGYRAVLDHNRMTLLDADGHTVATDGDHVQMGGGYAPAGNYATEPCLPDSGDVAVVQSDVTVVQ
jgi:hypothetical protein